MIKIKYMYKAAGIIFYRIDKFGNFEFLLQTKHYKNKIYIEDLGGKKEKIDNSIFETAAREAAEESNAEFIQSNIMQYDIKVKLCKIYFLKLMSENIIKLPYKKNYYMLYLVNIPYHSTDNLDFSDTENHPKFIIRRKIKWWTINEIKNTGVKKIHPRIRHFYRKIVSS